jgi:hypothetical protein
MTTKVLLVMTKSPSVSQLSPSAVKSSGFNSPTVQVAAWRWPETVEVGVDLTHVVVVCDGGRPAAPQETP